jgi:hypothetical protein
MSSRDPNRFINQNSFTAVSTDSNNFVVSTSKDPSVFPIESSDSTLVVANESKIIKIEQELNIEKLVVLQGPKGADAPPPEEDMPFSKQVDFINDNLLYVGQAQVGSLTSATAWRIKRITIGSDGDISEQWAGGTANYDKIWDSRLTYQYI